MGLFGGTHPSARLAVRAFALIALFLVAPSALAFCDSFHPLPEFYVGDTNTNSPTYDAACTHATIQQAIDAATCSYGTNIFITHEHAWTNQHLTIDNKKVTLIGRSNSDVCGPASVGICNPTCPPPITQPLVSISGQNGSGVFSITGTSNVTLRYLDINNGNNGGGNGGGVGFDGSGTLTVDTSWVRANEAVVGGGIYFNASPGGQLKLLAYTQILANAASDSGGGLAIVGGGRLLATEPHILIEGNHADAGYGGGVDIQGPSGADIGSPGYDGEEVISSNQAKYGGGIAVTVPDDTGNDAEVRLFTSDASQPVGIGNNSASYGGGIYLNAYLSFDSTSIAHMCAWDFRIDGNNAADGAAIFADNDSTTGAAIYLGSCPTSNDRTLLGGVACTNTTLCNTVEGDDTDDPGVGATIAIRDFAQLKADRFSMRHNQAAYMVQSLGLTQLSNCLLADNQTTQVEIDVVGAELEIDSCTLANDAVGASHVIHDTDYVKIVRSIIDEADTLALDFSGDPVYRLIGYVVSNDISTMPGALLATPKFVDVAGGDYHLQPDSIGVEFAPATDPAQIDLDGNPRSVDLPLADYYGYRDLGPYERQNLFQCGVQESDEVFCNGYDH